MMEVGSIIMAISNPIWYFFLLHVSFEVISYVAPELTRTTLQGTPAKLVCVSYVNRGAGMRFMFFILAVSPCYGLSSLIARIPSNLVIVLFFFVGQLRDGVQEHEGEERMGCLFWFL